MEDMKRLLAVLREVNEDVDFEGEQALVDDGLIDSLDITALIAALHETYGVRIKPPDIVPENFNSAGAILAMLRRYQAAV